jgi:predicted NAD/FAD-dependent oxidoreductase
MTDEVVVVGAGAAGCAVAYALRAADVAVTVVEAEAVVGGRAGTRERDGCTYETGANYLRTDDERVRDLLERQLPETGLVTIEDPIWTFDDAGTVSEGRASQGTRYTYEQGVAELPRRLIEAADTTVHCDRAVEAIARDGERWQIVTEGGATIGTYDATVLTPPGRRSADILAAGTWDGDLRERLRATIGGVQFRPIVGVALHYPFSLDRPYYALVNDDREHAVGWIARESRKPGHVPDGREVLVVQFGEEWSRTHLEAADGTVADAASAFAADLVGDDRLREPGWTDTRQWQYAAPESSPAQEVLATAGEYDLYFAGDWVVGEDRLHAAIASGLDTGREVSVHLR